MRTILVGTSGKLLSGYSSVVELGRYNVSVNDSILRGDDWTLSGKCKILDKFRVEHTDKFDLLLEFESTDNWYSYRWESVTVEFAPDGKSLVINGHGKPEVRK